ncbi:hypothetical protein H9Q69_003799 [Fusarium xylarioides]|uniref:Uncharacterized protein n=1 Tax=Fusarium xylarioides TaxID=221167 RepID=A0A9P7INU9_9HYPO|nr:hypothetical protein H9Q72_011034 [Fusarium xylarioides]KAG5797190.1 hypothetical protein H9Q69_003799 [Fusarium xylarioides]KAG5813365.1 hypothetical protein H9Q71_003778 [Fusarium xylarioides]KAG5826648.1 hypothetical protein H9Q74_003276 [Fusarium xylarioides]
MPGRTSPTPSVMTQEAYRKKKEEQNSEDEEENINYDSDDDNKPKKQNDQRKRQEAHLAGYRQQMMKTTEGPPSIEHSRIPSIQGPWMNIPEDYSDDDVPLAMLQARSQRDRMSRLAGVRSNPNLRASAQQRMMRPGSAQGKPDNGSHLRLPSFATNLSQDPFQDPFQTKKPMFTGGLISVIANEERAKASRRGTPSASFQAPQNPFALTGASPYMPSPYGAPMPHQLSRPQTPSGQIHQQIPQGIQDQMQFIQTMTFGAQHQSDNSWGSMPPRPGTSGSMAPAVKPALPAYGGYAQSIPPAERSNVGLPSRYRAVSKQKA